MLFLFSTFKPEAPKPPKLVCPEKVHIFESVPERHPPLGLEVQGCGPALTNQVAAQQRELAECCFQHEAGRVPCEPGSQTPDVRGLYRSHEEALLTGLLGFPAGAGTLAHLLEGPSMKVNQVLQLRMRGSLYVCGVENMLGCPGPCATDAASSGAVPVHACVKKTSYPNPRGTDPRSEEMAGRNWSTLFMLMWFLPFLIMPAALKRSAQ